MRHSTVPQALAGGIVLSSILLILTLAVGLPPAAGQGHDHGAAGGPILLTHDGPADGRQFAGNLAHFAAIARGDDAIPDFHQDLPLRISLDGVVLFQTSPDSGHDYDGINVVDLVFPHAGTYLVEALGADGATVASFGGEVLPAPNATVRIGSGQNPTDLVLAGQPVRFTHEVLPEDAAGSRVAHTDCWFEVVRNGATWFRTKTHTHDEAQAVDYAFPEAGTYTVRTTCFQAFPSAKATLFLPAVVEHTVDVLPGAPLGSLASMAVNDGSSPLPPTDLNAVVLGAPGGVLQLVGTFDPYTVVGTNTLQHLTAAAIDPTTGVPRQHVDFEASLAGPAGILFASTTLHEYDGLYELAARQAVPGVYTLTVKAESGDWSDTIQMAYTVVAPVVPTSAGAVAYGLQGDPLPSGPLAPQGTEYILTAIASSGPFAHSEVEVRAIGPYSQVPVLQAKLHTHADGTFPFTAAFLNGPGGTVLQVDGFPLMPEAVLVPAGTQFTLLVPHAEAYTSAIPGGEAAQTLPAAGVLVALLALAVVGMGRRRA